MNHFCPSAWPALTYRRCYSSKSTGHDSSAANNSSGCSIFTGPLIRRVTSIAGYAEEYGTGTLRMIEEMKKAGLPEPKVGFWARLFGGGG